MSLDVRGQMAGAGSWTHQNANAGNTICSDDQIVKGPLEMFWFRDVDFGLANRHGQAPAPLFHEGITVVGGLDGLCALDAYNGRTLWTFEAKGKPPGLQRYSPRRGRRRDGQQLLSRGVTAST